MAPSSGRRAVPLVVALFTLITGVALLLVGAMLADLRVLPAVDATSASRAAVDRFYAGQDAALRTGDPFLLIAAVDPAFVDHVGHGPDPAATRDRTRLVGEVAALRRAQPGVRLAAEPLLIAGDRVLVSVRTQLGDAASPADATVTPEPASADPADPKDSIEVVRVAGGVVAERWILDGIRPEQIVATTPDPDWTSSRMATATTEGLVCLASACH